MSGNAEKIVKNEYGHVVVRNGRASYVKVRLDKNSKCEYPDCNNDDVYSTCYGSDCSLSRLCFIVCEEHLQWGLDGAEEQYIKIEGRREKR